IFPNGNFSVDETGINYTFNEYEIAAYVVGATHVHLSFEEIKHLARKESPIAHLVF
ncbi:RsiV family protein, partial [Macellibacteroides fermentans]|nr:RsiV family protein [Macellibacteroides fermentans]